MRLALLFICASVRKGEWLVPAFHACIDEKIEYFEDGRWKKDSHDDPQNFELSKFTNEVLRLLVSLKTK